MELNDLNVIKLFESCKMDGNESTGTDGIVITEWHNQSYVLNGNKIADCKSDVISLLNHIPGFFDDNFMQSETSIKIGQNLENWTESKDVVGKLVMLAVACGVAELFYDDGRAIIKSIKSK